MMLSEMQAALDEAEAVLRRADMVTNAMAKMLVGRLHKVDRYGVLKELKNELRDYNAHTGRWKDGK